MTKLVAEARQKLAALRAEREADVARRQQQREQQRREQQRQRKAAEAAAAAAAEATATKAAAERLHMEEKRAAIQERQAALALELQQMNAQLGVAPPAAPQLEEEALCVVCMDAPKQHIILPCGHQCVCEACAQQLTQTTSPSCPVCRAPIRETTRVYR